MGHNQYSSGLKLSDLNLRAVAFCLLLLCGIAITIVAAQYGFLTGMVVACIPIAAFAIVAIISNPYWGLMAVFTVNYFIMGIVRYFPGLPGGPVMDVILGLTTLAVFIRACFQTEESPKILNGLTIASGIWLLYCCMEIFNLEGASVKGWATSIRGVALYFFVLSVITPLIFKHYRDLTRILYMWSAFTLVAVLKAYIQKNYGFDAKELYWLYVEGGKTTHLIYSGIRYFSIFTDAANFGAGMGFSMVAFSIAAFATKKTWTKVYFLAVAAVAAYAMMISGTRGAMAVPFAGYALYIILSRNWKVAIIFGLGLFGTYYLLSQTMHLHGNAYVRRMRTAFDTNEPSYRIRLDNQAKMRKYLASRPFGVGIGMGGGKAKDYAPKAYMSQLPTDSWFVMLWAETGIVGLSLYVTILCFLIIRCSYIVMFKIKDRTLKGILSGALCGIVGIIVASYGNEILGQFPNGFIVYIMLAFIFMGPKLDKQIQEEQELKPIADGQ